MNAAGHMVLARNFEFAVAGGGSTLTIAAGDQVTWRASGDPHTVTSGAPGAIDDRFADRPATAGLLMDGDSFTATFAQAGTYPYFCEIHPEQMRGVVVVVAVSTPAPTPLGAPTPGPTPGPSPRPTAGATPQPTPEPTRGPSPGLTAASPGVTPAAAASAPPISSTPPAGADAESSPAGSEAATDADAAPDASAGGPPFALLAIGGAVALAGLLAAARRRPGGGA